MEIGIYANTHGQGFRDETDMFLAHTPFEEMRPVHTAQLAEQNGQPTPVIIPVGKGVGGTTVVNSGTCFRIPEFVHGKWQSELRMPAGLSAE